MMLHDVEEGEKSSWGRDTGSWSEVGGWQERAHEVTTVPQAIHS